MIRFAAIFSVKAWGLLLCALIASVLNSAFAEDIESDPMFPAVELVPLYGGAQEPVIQPGQLTYVDLWASWCGPCAKTMPELDALAKTYVSDDIRFVMITVDEDPNAARQFAHRIGVKSNQYSDPEGGLMSALGVPGLPTGYLVDGDGRVRLVHVGGAPNSISFLKAHVDQLLAEQRFSAFVAKSEN